VFHCRLILVRELGFVFRERLFFSAGRFAAWDFPPQSAPLESWFSRPRLSVFVAGVASRFWFAAEAFPFSCFCLRLRAQDSRSVLHWFLCQVRSQETKLEGLSGEEI
jgi:hypothetical protein